MARLVIAVSSRSCLAEVALSLPCPGSETANNTIFRDPVPLRLPFTTLTSPLSLPAYQSRALRISRNSLHPPSEEAGPIRGQLRIETGRLPV